ncbi:MAG: Exosome non-catalytic core component [Alyxoria varia]|nr:MAG: Exosome non-catalytic core component [Alyxoria varia]
MPLDTTSSYPLALLRPDGRRWNELRRFQAQLSPIRSSSTSGTTMAGSISGSVDGSSYLEMGNTKVLCTVVGPVEEAQRVAGGAESDRNKAVLSAEVNVAGFSGVERRRQGGRDKRTTEMSHTLVQSLSPNVLLHLYPRSTITLTCHVLSQDGGMLAACLNAATLALVDAGVPMRGYIVGCSAGSMGGKGGGGGTVGDGSSKNEPEEEQDPSDPLLDLNSLEETELPSLTIGLQLSGGTTTSSGDLESTEKEKVTTLISETRFHVARLEGMMAVAVDGCRSLGGLMDEAVRRRGEVVLGGGGGGGGGGVS